MNTLKTLAVFLALFAFAACAQTPAPAPAACAAGTDVGYTYSGSAVVGYNSPLGAGVAAGSAFGVKVGTCSKAIFEAAIWTGVTGPTTGLGYSLFTGTFEYDLVKNGNWVFGGDGT